MFAVTYCCYFESKSPLSLRLELWKSRCILVPSGVFPNSLGLDGKPQVLIQMIGNKYGKNGIFELVIREGLITHQRFIPGGIINGVPNQIVPGAPGGVSMGHPWWR